jgi:predicted ATP-binding protein involved in virulence
MNSSAVLRIDSLSLNNFRCFSKCEVEFENDLTVLVAENGQGKTAVLDAVAIAAGTFVNAITGTYQSPGFGRTDIHFSKHTNGEMTPTFPAWFSARGLVAGSEMEWDRAIRRDSPRPRATTSGTTALRLSAKHFIENIAQAADEFTLPLVASYGTGRLWSEQISSIRKRNSIDPRSRLAGYADCFSTSSPFHGFMTWYEGMVREIGSPQFAIDLPRNIPLLNAVRNAVREVLEPSGWQVLNWNPEIQRIVVEHEEFGQLPLALMSDGVQSMIALVADIAHRCAKLNPHFDDQAALRTPGILLIDEVDMHLHPRWQQVVITLLQKAFPSMQMIVSTHSPHVLSTVNARCIRIIELSEGNGHVRPPHSETRGVESSAVLADAMSLSSIPPVEEARWLSDYRALVQSSNEDSEDAHVLRERILEHYGREHPVMEEVKVLRRLQEFRRAKRLPPPRGE